MRILLSGYYGFGNLGDEALLSGLTQALLSRGHEPVVLSGDPAATRAMHGIAAIHRTRGLPGALLAADALVSGGGGLLQDGTSQRSLGYYLAVIRLARLLRRPVAVYGQSLGPLSVQGQRRVAAALAGVSVFLRDEPSRALAMSLGLNARLVADPALLLSGPAAREVAASRPVVVIPRGGQAELNRALERLAARLVTAGQAVQVTSLHPVEDDDAARRILAAAPAASSARVATPADALTLFRNAAYVVSVRLHGCILAARAGTGFAGLSYDRKVAGFLELASAPSFAVPVDDEALFETALAQPAPDPAATAWLVALARSGVDELVAALERGSSGDRGGRRGRDRSRR